MDASLSAQTSSLQNSGSLHQKRKGPVSSHHSHPNRLRFFLLLVLGASLLLTNRWFTEVDDECAIIDRAARPILQTIRLYLSGAGEHEHPPLYDLILHGWLRLTHAEQFFLRLPAIVFYLAGAWLLAIAVERWAGNRPRTYTLLLILLWPYGFHFGRLAAWYSFCFFLVALVTWSYFRYLQSPDLRNGCWLIVFSVLLLYSNYFAWALLGCLTLDFIIENRKMSRQKWAGLAGVFLLLLAAYVPIVRAFVAELHAGVHPNGHIATLFFTGIYDLYCVFVSESVAPWFWVLGVPAAAAIVTCLIITTTSVPPRARRFLLYFAGLLAVMSLLGTANTKRMLFISPWLIVPIAMAMGQSARKSRRAILAAALVFIASVGWYGIFARNLYAAPHWVEPWRAIAQNAANIARTGGIVIGNNPSFFFYLTYDTAMRGDESARNFAGLLPDSTRRPNIYDRRQWIDAGRPIGPRIIVAMGMPQPNAFADEAEPLSGRCLLERTERLVHDAGAEWKERFAPESGQAIWRIEVNTYSCP